MNASRKLTARWEQAVQAQLRSRGLEPATDEQMAAKEREIRREMAERKAQILLGRLDARYREATPRTKTTAMWLKGYLAAGDNALQRARGLVVLGDPGVGKTWEVAAIARILLTVHGIPVSLVEAPELMAALRPSAEGASDIGQFMAAPVLIIDDLGAERTSEWTAEQMFRLANYRNIHCLPTIFTSNLNGEQLRGRYGDRVIDRLTDRAMLLTIDQPVEAFRRSPI